MSITSSVKGESAVIERFKNLPGDALERLRVGMTRLALKLQRKVVTEKLSGQLLKVRTGTLRRSIQYRIDNVSNGVIATVGSRINEANPLKYAAPHEYGFQGSVNVKQHLRMMTTAFGKDVKNPRQILVKAHQMRVNIKEKAYLRSSLKEMREEIKADMTSSVRGK